MPMMRSVAGSAEKLIWCVRNPMPGHIIPVIRNVTGFDYLVIENTLIKDGPRVECVTRLPIHVQDLISF